MINSNEYSHKAADLDADRPSDNMSERLRNAYERGLRHGKIRVYYPPPVDQAELRAAYKEGNTKGYRPKEWDI